MMKTPELLSQSTSPLTIILAVAGVLSLIIGLLAVAAVTKKYTKKTKKPNIEERIGEKVDQDIGEQTGKTRTLQKTNEPMQVEQEVSPETAAKLNEKAWKVPLDPNSQEAIPPAEPEKVPEPKEPESADVSEANSPAPITVTSGDGSKIEVNPQSDQEMHVSVTRVKELVPDEGLPPQEASTQTTFRIPSPVTVKVKDAQEKGKALDNPISVEVASTQTEEPLVKVISYSPVKLQVETQDVKEPEILLKISKDMKASKAGGKSLESTESARPVIVYPNVQDSSSYSSRSVVSTQSSNDTHSSPSSSFGDATSSKSSNCSSIFDTPSNSSRRSQVSSPKKLLLRDRDPKNVDKIKGSVESEATSSSSGSEEPKGILRSGSKTSIGSKSKKKVKLVGVVDGSLKSVTSPESSNKSSDQSSSSGSTKTSTFSTETSSAPYKRESSPKAQKMSSRLPADESTQPNKDELLFFAGMPRTVRSLERFEPLPEAQVPKSKTGYGYEDALKPENKNLILASNTSQTTAPSYPSGAYSPSSYHPKDALILKSVTRGPRTKPKETPKQPVSRLKPEEFQPVPTGPLVHSFLPKEEELKSRLQPQPDYMSNAVVPKRSNQAPQVTKPPSVPKQERKPVAVSSIAPQTPKATTDDTVTETDSLDLTSLVKPETELIKDDDDNCHETEFVEELSKYGWRPTFY